MTGLLYDQVIFDLDGTLSDSQTGILRSVAYALDKMDKPAPSQDVLRKFLGPPLADSYISLCGMSEAEAQRGTDVYRERYNTVGWMENAVFPGMRELLYALKNRGAVLSVATGKPQSITTRVLEYFDLLKYFDSVAGPEESDYHADKASLIGRVLKKGARAVMVGDREFDILGAKKAGIDGIGVLYGYGGKDEISACAPKYTCATVGDLSVLLLGEIPSRKGFFISVEGMDGCGKTTQLRALEERLTKCGYPLRVTREPGGCRLSEQIRDILLDERNTEMSAEAEALLYAAARAQHVRQVIRPALDQGRIVLCDRFVDSSVAYQGGGRQLGVKCVSDINAPAVRACMPDVTLLLRIDQHQALLRRRQASKLDRIENESDAFFTRTQDAYEQLQKFNQDRYIVLDASLPREVITQKAFEALCLRLTREGVA